MQRRRKPGKQSSNEKCRKPSCCEESLFGKKFCRSHCCSGCDLLKLPEKIYCAFCEPEYICSAKGCEERRYKIYALERNVNSIISPFCRGHTCGIVNCLGYKSRATMVCADHLCLGCKKLPKASDDHEYCLSCLE